MKQKKEQIIRWAFLVLCCLVLTAGSVVLLNQKEALFVDEFSSYGCANGENGKLLPFENRTTYQASELQQMAVEHYSVSKDDRFQFGGVLNNLSISVHPPVFYLLLHFVCSLTPGVFSLWQGAAVNLLFGLVSLVFFQKLVRSFTRSEWLAGFLCLCWACTPGLLMTTILIRDYAGSMCSCLIVLWECFRYLRGHRKIPDLVKIAAASSLSVLCHYYSAIYLFFLCAVLCVILMSRKEWKDVFRIFAAEGAAAIVTIAVFPAIIRSMFSSGRGVEATENLSNTDLSVLKGRLVQFFRSINQAFFGSMLRYLLILVILLAAVWLIKKKKGTLPVADAGERTVTVADACLLAVPAVCYFALVSKIAAFVNIRYMYPATPMMYLSAVAVLIYLGTRLPKKRLLALGLAAVMAAVCCFAWSVTKLPYLYRGLNKRQQAALEPYQGIEAVQIWENWNAICVALSQYDYYSTVSLYYHCSDEKLAQIPALTEGRDVMVLIGKRIIDQNYVEKLLSFYPGYTVTEIGSVDGQKRFYNYYFHKEPAEANEGSL